MIEDREALIRHYRESRAALQAAIDGLDDAAMSEPSLDGWSVKDHLAHLALWDDIRAGEVQRISAGHDSAWRMTEAQVETYNELGQALARPLSVAQVRWELAATRQRLLDALGAATARGLDGSRYEAASLRSSHEAEHTGWIARWRRERRR